MPVSQVDTMKISSAIPVVGFAVCIVLAGGCDEIKSIDRKMQRNKESPDLQGGQSGRNRELQDGTTEAASELEAAIAEKERQIAELETRVAELATKLQDLIAANRKVIAEFQQMEHETMRTDEAVSISRKAMLSGVRAGQTDIAEVYVWDKPGGFAANATILSKVASGHRVLVLEQSGRGPRTWYRVVSEGGEGFHAGWVPGGMVVFTQ